MLFVPSGIHHHLFENLRRKGHHCHGRKRLSGGRPQKVFCLLLGKKFCGMCISPPDWRRRLWLSMPPGDRGLNR
ncbi:hypothetical protein HT118_17340 [Escherichia coli]|nr:hypothetical protein [Escherichia coli]